MNLTHYKILSMTDDIHKIGLNEYINISFITYNQIPLHLPDGYDENNTYNDKYICDVEIYDNNYKSNYYECYTNKLLIKNKKPLKIFILEHYKQLINNAILINSQYKLNKLFLYSSKQKFNEIIFYMIDIVYDEVKKIDSELYFDLMIEYNKILMLSKTN